MFRSRSKLGSLAILIAYVSISFLGPSLHHWEHHGSCGMHPEHQHADRDTCDDLSTVSAGVAEASSHGCCGHSHPEVRGAGICSGAFADCQPEVHSSSSPHSSSPPLATAVSPSLNLASKKDSCEVCDRLWLLSQAGGAMDSPCVAGLPHRGDLTDTEPRVVKALVPIERSRGPPARAA